MMNRSIFCILVCIFIACVFGQEPKIIDICSLPSETGKCKGHFPRYYYNGLTTHCELFMYGGCGGNQNNFETIFECRKTCGQTMPAEKNGVGVPLMHKNSKITL